ncbi:hypothetical protein ACI3KS_05015 [Microbacterium sp. ZW T5_45]|uniref:hypothetical protein n=1 Tax=Microbacterium sp. ZW T5_45 TaxID=3378080 RepID=UPI0038547730
MNFRFASTAASVILLTATLVACSGSPEGAPTSGAERPSAGATSQPSGQDSGEPTCETIVSEGTVAGLTDAGWTAERKDFVIGTVALPDGMLCFWADYSQASDHGQLYGWSEISSSDAESAQGALAEAGWIREDAPEGSYFTENPEFALNVDDEGYGMTYLFGDGWVKLADTKQSLILVDWAE